jgi:hypothetical protein
MRARYLFVLIAFLSTPGAASAQEAPAAHRVSAQLGLNYTILGRPDDQPGDVTLLAGSAFLGGGFALGLGYEWAPLEPFALETGLYYTRSAATGLAALGSEEREVTVEADILRVPLWGKARLSAWEGVHLLGGLGPELLLGLTSAATIIERNIPADAQGLVETTSVTSLYLTAFVGVEIDAGPLRVPLRLHASVNPLTGASTRARLDGFQSQEAPGQLRMEFDYEVLFLTGASWGL